MSAVPSVTLYTRAGCHLCEEALAGLESLRAWAPHTLTVVDVDDDPALAATYEERVPVLMVDGQTFDPPLDRPLLERALRVESPTRARTPTLLPEDAVAVSPGRRQLDGWVVRVADPVLTGVSRHWLALLNSIVVAFLAGGLLAPWLLMTGAMPTANALYELYSAVCHQWAFRSFFLFGPQWVYSRDDLAGLGVDPYRFVGNGELGWKMAFCERDLAIFTGLLAFGALYAARLRPAGLRPAGYVTYVLLVLPMVLDGGTQLLGQRESSWELRLATGLVFGLASGWLMLPRFNQSFAKVLR